jgi:hypothetical protein
MLTREFAHEIAKEVFDMLEQKWDARRAAAIARKEQEEIERAARKEREAQERAERIRNRLPGVAQKMLDALQRVEGINGGPVWEGHWRDELRAQGMEAQNIRTSFSRYKEMLLRSGRITYENGLWSVTSTASKSAPNVPNASFLGFHGIT